MLNWGPAPRKIDFGNMPNGMVMTDVEIDKDHTLSLYCEESQKDFVITALRKMLQWSGDER